MRGFPHPERPGRGPVPQQRPQAKFAPLCILLALSTPGGHAPEAGKGVSPPTLSSSKRQPPQPPLKQLGWIPESSPHPPPPPHPPRHACILPLPTSNRWWFPPPKTSGSSQNPWTGEHRSPPQRAPPGQQSADSGGPGLLPARSSCCDTSSPL